VATLCGTIAGVDMEKTTPSELQRLVRRRQENHDSRDHDVCENVRYPGSEHAASASPNDSHEQPVDASEANAEPAARKPPDMDRAKGKGLQQKSRESGPE
jgi:hypothetical protein